MRLVDAYIAKSVAQAMGLVLLMLSGLQFFIIFISQLGDLGKGDYGILQTFRFVLLHTPYQMILFFPMASLLGCLIGLGGLARDHELVVMRASGMSVWQVSWAVMKAALLIIFIVTALGETIVPKMSYYANQTKAIEISGGQTLKTPEGMWIKIKRNFINIGSILPDSILKNVYQFQFDAKNHLNVARHIEKLSVQQGKWLAEGVNETRLKNQSTTSKHLAQVVWDVSVDPAILSIANRYPQEMRIDEMAQFLNARGLSKQTVFLYKLEIMQRLIQPLNTLIMMLLAIPFIFGPLRSSTMGSKLLTGVAMGFAFHMIHHFFGPFCRVMQWPPLIAAIAPTIIFALLGTYLVSRVR